MKKNIYYTLWLLAPIALWAQADVAAPVEIDLSDVIVIEDTSPSEDATDATTEVVEIPEMPIEGASIDLEAPVIPEASESLPSDTEIVLEIPGQEASEPGEASMESEETISVDFPDEDVRTILRNVADLFELNLVIPDTLQGRTSIKLRNITWRQAFEVVLEPLGYTYVEDRNIIRIKSIEELTTEPVDTRVFVANYARAEDLQGSIAPLVDGAAGGRIQVDKRSNALVITERPSRMNKIQEIIERLDKATDQVMIESKFIEVTNTDTKNLGINWASLSGYSVSAGPFQRQWNRSRTTSENSGNSINRDSTNGWSDKYDKTPSGGITSAANDASSTTTTSSGSLDGVPKVVDITTLEEEGSTSGTSLIDAFSTDVSSSTALSSFADRVSAASTGRLDTALFSAGEFEVILSALKSNNDVKLVSNPTVVTLNNTKAKIAIGERFPIPTYTFNAETGQRQLDEIEYEDIGINLDVTPQVNAAGFINLQIMPEVSSTDRFSIIENTQIPIIESRRTETSIVIKDGYTLAIGGLVENSNVDRGTKVPLLGDLPGVGRFFRSESDEITSRNLIIFITARTLNPDGSTYKDIIDPRVINEMGILPSDVPGYKVPQDHIDTFNRIDEVREKTTNAEEIIRLKENLDALEKAEKMRLKRIAEESE